MIDILNDPNFNPGLKEELYDDPRRIPLSAIEQPLGESELPSSHMTDISMLVVNDQGRTGSCVGQATSKMKEYQEYIEDGVVYDFSPRFVYANAKKIDNYDGWGTYLRTGVKVANLYGSVRRDEFFPENTNLPDKEFRDWKIITQDAYEEGRNFITKSYAYVYRGDLSAIKSAIIAHGVLVGGLNGTNQGFRVSKTDPMVKQPADGETIWGHSIAFYGYKTRADGKTELWFRNSWARNWGIDGNGYLIYEDYKPLFDMWLSVDLPSELIKKAQSMIPLIRGDKRPEVYAHNTRKNYKAWVNAEVLQNWMGQLWGKNGWTIDQLMADYVKVIPQADADALREVDVFVGKVVV